MVWIIIAYATNLIRDIAITAECKASAGYIDLRPHAFAYLVNAERDISLDFTEYSPEIRQNPLPIVELFAHYVTLAQ